MSQDNSAPRPAADPAADGPARGRGVLMACCWLWVGLPFGYGLYELGLKLKQLFTG
ncbi:MULTISPECIES: hypothetical protein [Streptomyces]|uniref:Uncharacterized protein n=1 Tax=Streptomyces lycii TaxID=2654337 RepID=A0ABQ7FA49_9ACTN|nr:MULTISPECIES: hypothetical protein [Streptomyces]KAF4405642.1 hypothetical protein GCU69_29135 [Streptomyces lycii]